MSTAKHDARSLMAEWREHAVTGKEVGPKPSEEERAEALREYEKLVSQIDDVVREQEIQRRTRDR